MTHRIKFNVFGRRMLVEGSAGNWRLYALASDGKRSPLDIPIPDFVTEGELAQYLGDIFHESATPRHPDVRRLTND
jgi:hypothetical protein